MINLRVTIHDQFTDSDIISEHRQTETYVNQDGSWLLAVRQRGNLPVNFRKPVAVNTSYKDHVSQHKWRPVDPLEFVSVKDGKLWSQLGVGEGEALPSE